MRDNKEQMDDAKWSELNKLAVELVRGSIIEKAASRFVAQVMAEAHTVEQEKHQRECEKLEERIAELERERDLSLIHI